MKTGRMIVLPLLIALSLFVTVDLADAVVNIQCPGDSNGDAIPEPGHPAFRPNVKCMHVSGGDGFSVMGDGTVLYTFGFADLTGIADNPATPIDERMEAGMLAAEWSAPTIVLDEGDEFYLNLTNVGMLMRPDLFDPHSVHWHGFPQAASIFDGVPDASISINMGSTLTYYYNVVEPGTYLWHCHVEATEHMQMGMLGNLYVRPAQNKLPAGTNLNGFIHQAGFKYAYNDADGSTRYDVEFPIQMGGFDGYYHEQHLAVQPLPFALMKDTYAMLNGRGYPDTVNPGWLPAPAENGGKVSQKVSSLIQATAGQKVLLRISNVSIARFYTLATLGVPMRVVGKDARLLRGPDGKNLAYVTNSVTLGGGETADVILDTTGMAPGTYFLYTTNLNYLSNNTEDFGGMMTEIRIN